MKEQSSAEQILDQLQNIIDRAKAGETRIDSVKVISTYYGDFSQTDVSFSIETPLERK